MKAIIVCGIDTDIGKTYVSGSILAQLAYNNFRVSSFKPVQTGCNNFSVDLQEHKKIVDLYAQERDSLRSSYNLLGNEKMCSYIFSQPVSPHLASANEQQYIKVDKILEDFTNYLTQLYPQVNLNNLLTNTYHQLDYLVVELAGGIMSPVNDLLTNLDLIEKFRDICQSKKIDFEVVLVTAGKLGSISHTLSALTLLPQVDYLIYNYTLLLNQSNNLVQEINANNLEYYYHLQEVAKATDLLNDFKLSQEEIKNLPSESKEKQAYELLTSYALKDKYLLTNSFLIKNLNKVKIKKFTNYNSKVYDFA